MSRGFLSEPALRRVLDGIAALALVLFAFSLPLSAAIARATAGIAAAAFVARLVLERGRGWRRNALDLPVLAFLLAQLAGVIFSKHFSQSFVRLPACWMILVYFVVSQTLRDRRDVTRVLDVFMLAGAGVAIYGIWQHAAGWDAMRDVPLEPIGLGFVAIGLFENHVAFGGVMLVTAVLGTAFALAPAASVRRYLYGAAALAASVALLGSYTRAAWIGWAAGILAALAFRGRRAVLAGMLILAAVLAGAFTIDSTLAHRARGVLDPLDPAFTNETRLWRGAVSTWSKRVLTGAGPGVYAAEAAKNHPSGSSPWRAHPHSDPLEILVDSGLLGIAAFLALLGLLVRNMLLSRSRAPASMSTERAHLSALAAALAGFLVAGLGQSYLHGAETGTIFWFLAACAVVVARAAEMRTRTEGFGRGLP